MVVHLMKSARPCESLNKFYDYRTCQDRSGSISVFYALIQTNRFSKNYPLVLSSNTQGQPSRGHRHIPELLIDLLSRSEESAVIVLCTADWVGSSDMFLDFLYQEVTETAQISVVDIEAHPDIKSYLSIEKLPTTLILKNRHILDRIEGIISRRKIKERLQEWT